MQLQPDQFLPKSLSTEHINNLIKDHKIPTGLISDGYHTFDELYEHRIILFIKLCELINSNFKHSYPKIHSSVWKSKKHSDDTSWEGWFIMGIGKEKNKQITYHLPMKYWKDTDFAEELDKAPEWDKHTSDDVLERLLKL